MNSPLFETLAAALDSAFAEFKAKGAVLVDEQNMRDKFAIGGLSYGETKEAHGEIAALKGRKTKKYAHLTIYRKESGRYEVVAYVL